MSLLPIHLGSDLRSDRRRRSALRRSLCLAVVLPGCIVALAAQLPAADERPPATGTVKVRVLDRLGRPVGGIRLHLTALATEAGEVIWDEKRNGPAEDAVTDADGRTTIRYPLMPRDQQPTVALSCEVRHPDWVQRRHNFRPGKDETVIRLAPGMRLAVNAVRHDTGEPITENVHAVLGGDSLRDQWQRYSHGLLVSPTVSYNRTRLRVVWLPDDGPAHFSDIIKPVESGRRPRIRVRDVVVSPGARIHGRLSDNVPRPIVDGFVMATASHHAGMRDKERRLEWKDWVPIAPDGSFELPSLPRDGFVELFARCDGWISAKPTRSDLEKAGLAEYRGVVGDSIIPLPHVFRLGRSDRNCEIFMRQTAECLVRTIGPDGAPVAGVSVLVRPGQRSFSGGQQPYGRGLRYAQLLQLPWPQRLQVSTPEGRRQLELQGIMISPRAFFDRTTDADGRTVISQLPSGTDEARNRISVHFAHPEYQLQDNSRPTVVTVTPFPGQPTPLNVEMVPRQ